MSLQFGRRGFLSSLGAVGTGLLGAGRLDALAAVTGGAGSHAGAAGHAGIPVSSPGMPFVDGHPIVPITKGFCSTGNPWAELGVTPIVNTNGTVTVIGGSVMKPEVMEAIRYGNMHFVVLDELLVKSGKWIADLIKAPAGYTAMVTEGDAAALLVGYSGLLTEDYNERLLNIPDLRGFPKSEVIVQTGHRDNFDHQIRQTGVKLVEVVTREEMIAAINPKTLAIHFLNIQSNRGQVNAPDTVAIGKQHGVYTYLDASADVPPKERLWEFPAIGFDLIAFSGGKDICGPQATGLLIGREQLVHWALLNMSPQENRIGRPCKVGKESLFGLVKALELFVNQDYAETLRRYDAKAATITNALARYGVTMERTYNEAALGNVSPRYTWTFDPAKVKLTGAEITKQLGETKPVAIGAGAGANSSGMGGRTDPNWTGPYLAAGNAAGARPAGGAAGGAPAAGAAGAARGGRGGSPNSFGFSTWMLKDGEDKYIAHRLVEIFSAAAVPGSFPAVKVKVAAKKG